MPEVEDNVPLPTNEGWAIDPATLTPPPEAAPAPAKRGRPKKAPGEAPTPRKSAKAVSGQAEALERALAFVEPVTKSDILPAAKYVSLCNNMAVVYNGQFAAGHPIEESLNCAPNLEKLKIALAKTGKKLALTENTNGSLTVQGERLRTVIPCMPLDEIVYFGPNAPLVTGDFDLLKQAFKACCILADENGQRVIEASVLLQNNTVTSTNGYALVQFWHGYPMPADFVLPKAFCVAVAASPLKITGLSGHWNEAQATFDSFTVWFENGAWYKTQTYFDKWPEIDHIINIPCNPVPVPEGFFDGVAAVVKLGEDESRAIHLNMDNVSNSRDVAVECGAMYTVPELNASKTVNGELLLKLKPFIETIDFNAHERQIMFFGGSMRGTLMVMSGG